MGAASRGSTSAASRPETRTYTIRDRYGVPRQVTGTVVGKIEGYGEDRKTRPASTPTKRPRRSGITDWNMNGAGEVVPRGRPRPQNAAVK